MGSQGILSKARVHTAAMKMGGRRETRHHPPAGEGLPLPEKKNNGARGKKGEAMARARARGWLGLPFCNGHLGKLWVRRANVDKLWVPR